MARNAPVRPEAPTSGTLTPAVPRQAGPVGHHRLGRPGPAAPSTRPLAALLGSLVIAAGVVLGLSGGATWLMVQSSLSAEHITVSADAAHFGGRAVDGPLTAYYEADIIKHHSLTASGGRTYAQLDKADPVRATVMNGSFLRASLFTSVVSFGIAAMAMGLGVVFVLIGLALRATARRTTA